MQQFAQEQPGLIEWFRTVQRSRPDGTEVEGLFMLTAGIWQALTSQRGSPLRTVTLTEIQNAVEKHERFIDEVALLPKTERELRLREFLKRHNQKPLYDFCIILLAKMAKDPEAAATEPFSKYMIWLHGIIECLFEHGLARFGTTPSELKLSGAGYPG